MIEQYGLPELERIWRLYKTSVWQFLDGKFDSIFAWDSEWTWDTVSKVFNGLLFLEQMLENVLKLVGQQDDNNLY